MLTDEDEIQAHIESLTEELRAIPAHAHNAQKIADRRNLLDRYRAELTRRRAVRQAWLDRRHELLARCRVYGGKH